jgi:hypothetical protein
MRDTSELRAVDGWFGRTKACRASSLVVHPLGANGLEIRKDKRESRQKALGDSGQKGVVRRSRRESR